MKHNALKALSMFLDKCYYYFFLITKRFATVGFPGSSAGTCNAGDPGSIPGFRRSPGGGYGNPLQYSCLESPMDRGAWEAMVHKISKKI